MHRIRVRMHRGGRAAGSPPLTLGPAAVRRAWSRRIAARFPPNPYVRRLVAAAQAMDIAFEPSPVPQEWMYHPGRRAVLAWLPDLRRQSLSYLVVILAHELGHALDLGRRARRIAPHRAPAAARLGMERAAFVHGFLLLKRLAIPVSLRQYVAMIEPPMSRSVERALRRRLGCLLDRYGPDFARAASRAVALHRGLSSVA